MSIRRLSSTSGVSWWSEYRHRRAAGRRRRRGGWRRPLGARPRAPWQWVCSVEVRWPTSPASRGSPRLHLGTPGGEGPDASPARPIHPPAGGVRSSGLMAGVPRRSQKRCRRRRGRRRRGLRTAGGPTSSRTAPAAPARGDSLPSPPLMSAVIDWPVTALSRMPFRPCPSAYQSPGSGLGPDDGRPSGVTGRRPAQVRSRGCCTTGHSIPILAIFLEALLGGLGRVAGMLMVLPTTALAVARHHVAPTARG